MKRVAAFAIFAILLAAPAFAQTQEEIGAMLLRIRDLEERVRLLTGENERLTYEVNQMRAELGRPPLQTAPVQTGAVTVAPAPVLGNLPAPGGTTLGEPPVQNTLGTLSVSPDDPLIAPDGMPDGMEDGAPVDLSTLAGGVAGELFDPNVPPGGQPAPIAPDGTSVAGLPGTPPPTAALSGSARDEYDLAYGYVLTGDYALAEQSFRQWLDAFPGDPQVADAQFWLGESYLQQGEYREAANTFLALYKSAPGSAKGPDSLVRLGVSLSALGERDAACGTFAEVGRKYPEVSEALLSRVRDEATRAGC